MFMTALIIWYFSDFFFTRNQKFLYKLLQYFKTFTSIYNYNILIMILNKSFKIEKLKVYQISCKIIQIFYENAILKCIWSSSDMFHIKHSSHLISIFKRNSYSFRVNSELIFNCSIHSEVNQKSHKCVKNLNIM